VERIAGVIGWPVEHSLSPALHNAAFQAGGIAAHYAAFAVAPGRAPAALAAVRTLGLLGLSVTTPHKEDVAAHVDELSAAAAALRSVNTVVVAGEGHLVGHSTDGDGFVASLQAEGVTVSGAGVAVLGAGAAARSLVDALGRAGATDVAIVNRNEARAEAAAALAPVARVGGPVDVTGADIVVNATSVGMGTTESPIDVALLRADQVVSDLVYHPLDTAFLRAARALGCRALDGLGMLVHQAVLQQVLWTGVRPDPALLRAAAEAELARRGG
jgi:shikimate dehydrogenase